MKHKFSDYQSWYQAEGALKTSIRLTLEGSAAEFILSDLYILHLPEASSEVSVLLYPWFVLASQHSVQVFKWQQLPSLTKTQHTNILMGH